MRPRLLFPSKSDTSLPHMMSILMTVQCIRDAMQAKNKNCPTCHEPMREGDIRRNRIIEDLVESWTIVRYV